MTQKDNIIPFPVKERMEQVHLEHTAPDPVVEEMVDDIASDVLAFLVDEGIEISNPDYMYTVSYFVESLRCMIFHMHDHYHPFREMSQALYENVKYEDPNQLEFDF